MMAFPRWAIGALALAFAFKVYVASQVPLNGDEAYYWAWSLHPALGYLDHPPMLGWLLWVSSLLGKDLLAVRLPFLACQLAAAVIAGRVAVGLSGRPAAAGIAALTLTFIPGPRWLLGQADPDAPFVLFWVLALWATLRLERNPNWTSPATLGIALGGAVLSRIFGWALVAGIIGYAVVSSHRALWKNGLRLALLIAIVLYLPFVWWNAAHGWQTFRFTFYERQTLSQFSLQLFAIHSTLRFCVFAIALIAYGVFVARPRGRALTAWTILPLTVALLALSPFHTTQPYWLLGPFAAAAVDFGIAFFEMDSIVRGVVGAIGGAVAVLAAVTVAAGALPAHQQTAWLGRMPPAIQYGLYDSDSAYGLLADDVNGLRRDLRTAVLTDSYGIAGELLYYGVANPVLVGTDPRIRQWRAWYDDVTIANEALVITSQPLADDRDLARRVEHACAHLTPGPHLHFSYIGTEPGQFFTAFCDRLRPDAALVLFAP